MKKIIVGGLLCLASCVQPGQQFSYQSNPNRTSRVVRTSTLKVTVGETTATDTSFKLEVYVKPILGQGQTNTISHAIDNAILADDFVVNLRQTIDYTTPEGVEVHHIGMSQDNCDLLRIDHIPDTDETQNLVVFPKVCVDLKIVPTIDITVTSQGQNVKIGYDVLRVTGSFLATDTH